MRERLILLSNCGGENIRIIEFDAREDTEHSTSEHLVERWVFTKSTILGSDFSDHDTDFSQLVAYYNPKPESSEESLGSRTIKSKVCLYKDWMVLLIKPSEKSGLRDLGLFVFNLRNRNFRVKLQLQQYGFQSLLNLYCLHHNKSFAI